MTALQDYVNSGWTVDILPWVVGARGIVGRDRLAPALDFLDIPKQKWTGIIESTVRASVEELVYMNGVRFSLSSQNRNFDTDDDPKSSCASHENLLNVANRHTIQRDSEDLRARPKRWKRIHGDRGQLRCAPDNGDRRPPPPPT